MNVIHLMCWIYVIDVIHLIDLVIHTTLLSLAGKIPTSKTKKNAIVPHLPELLAGQHCIVLMVAAFVFLTLYAAVGGGWLPDRPWRSHVQNNIVF